MHVQILGSSAGKPIPRQFCSCHICDQARRVGGKDRRTRTTLNVYPGSSWEEQGTIKRPRYQVDLSPDLTYQLDKQGVDVSDLEHLFITHSDADHCCGLYLSFRPSIRSSVDDLPLLHVYGNAGVQKSLPDVVNEGRARCEVHVIEDGDSFEAGELKVTTFASMHGGKRGCLHYGLDDGERKILMAWDGTWSEEVWERLKDWQFDALFMECTHLGPLEREMGGHLRAVDYINIKKRLIDQGTLCPDSLTVTVHMGDNGGLTHAQAEELMGEHDIIVGYDGLVVKVG